MLKTEDALNAYLKGDDFAEGVINLLEFTGMQQEFKGRLVPGSEKVVMFTIQATGESVLFVLPMTGKVMGAAEHLRNLEHRPTLKPGTEKVIAVLFAKIAGRLEDMKKRERNDIAEAVKKQSTNSNADDVKAEVGKAADEAKHADSTEQTADAEAKAVAKPEDTAKS